MLSENFSIRTTSYGRARRNAIEAIKNRDQLGGENLITGHRPALERSGAPQKRWEHFGRYEWVKGVDQSFPARNLGARGSDGKTVILVIDPIKLTGTLALRGFERLPEKVI